jgi:hypothetical protein
MQHQFVKVQRLHLGASRGEDGRPTWNLYLSEDATNLSRRGYTLDETQAWRLLAVLTAFLADYYHAVTFTHSDSLSDTPRVVTGSVIPSAAGSGAQHQ